MSLISSLSSAASGLMVYGGIFLLIAGLIGNGLNIIIFLSLKTFRQTSSVVYLTVASFVNIGQLLTGLISRIIFNAILIDWTLTSPFYCKFRIYLVHICAFTSLTCVNLATIDQFLATSARPRWQQWSNIKIAYYLSGITLVFWIIYLCPHLIYFELVEGDNPVCTPIDPIYSSYFDNFVVPILWFVLPFLISIIFGLLTYRNIKQIAYRTVPLYRRRVDEQLTVMILVQIIINIIVTCPYITYMTVTSHVSFSDDPLTTAQILLIKNLTLCLYYLYPVVRIFFSYQ
jgi:hypothetical protein